MTYRGSDGGRATSIGLLGVSVGLTLIALLTTRMASAAEAPVGLGTAESFAVLGGQSVTNIGPSVITGDLGVSPGTSITGFPPGMLNGVEHNADEVALQAQTDLTTAYNDAAGRTPTANVATELGGTSLLPGVYASATLGITGTLTLNGGPDDVFIFQTASTLITAAGSQVLLVGGVRACNVFWQVTSSATLGVNSTFAGTILALTTITATTGAQIDGRLLARNGSTTMDANRVTRAGCGTTTTSSTVVGATTSTTAVGATTSTTAVGATTSTTDGTGATTSTTDGTGATTSTTAGTGATTTSSVPGATTTTLPAVTTSSTAPTPVTPAGQVTTTTAAATAATTTTTVATTGVGTTIARTASVSTTVPVRAPLARTGTDALRWAFAGGLAMTLGGALLVADRQRVWRRRADWTRY